MVEIANLAFGTQVHLVSASIKVIKCSTFKGVEANKIASKYS